MVDWDALQRDVWRIVRRLEADWDQSIEALVRRLIQWLKAAGWRLNEETEAMIADQAAAVETGLRQAIEAAITPVAAAVVAEAMRPQFISHQVQEAFQRRWPDGLRLSDRLWRWREDTIRAVTETLAEGNAIGRSVSSLIFDMQRAIERTAGSRFAIVSDRKPKWLADLESAGRRAIHTPRARRAWQEAVREVEAYIDRLRDTGTRQQTLAMLNRMQEAVDQGRENLLEEAIRWRIYDKQLYNLKRIARTEISTAYHRATIAATQEDDLIIGYRWRLSASHPDPDICDWFAGIELGLGNGIWPKDRVPEEKAHPHCMCILTPVTRPNRIRGAKNPGELMAKLRPADKARIAPRWARDLNALGIDWNRMVDPATGWFARRKDIAAKVGKDRLQAMQALGRSLGERDWGGIRPRGGYRRRLMELAKQHSGDPAARRIRRALERDEPPSSLDVHYLKRRYVDGIDLGSPVDLDSRHDAVLQSSDALIYRQTMGESVRWVVRDLGGSWVAIVGMDGRRITAYPLEGEIPQTWEQKWPMSELKSL